MILRKQSWLFSHIDVLDERFFVKPGIYSSILLILSYFTVFLLNTLDKRNVFQQNKNHSYSI